jgi:hypothetical protein
MGPMGYMAKDIQRIKANLVVSHLDPWVTEVEDRISEPQGDHVCLNSQPPPGCTCKHWEDMASSYFKHGEPSGACCMNPTGYQVANTGWCYCIESTWQICGHAVDSMEDSYESSPREERALPISITHLTPHITKFMGSLIKPLVNSLANRATPSRLADTILQKFVGRALATTTLAKTETADSIARHLKDSQYSKALGTLQTRELPLNTTKMVPNDVDHVIRAVDKVFVTRLKTLSQVEMTFISTILEQFRVVVQRDHTIAQNSLSGIKRALEEVNTSILGPQQLNMALVYGLLITHMLLTCASMLLVLYFKATVLNFFNKHRVNKVTQRNRGALLEDDIQTDAV